MFAYKDSPRDAQPVNQPTHTHQQKVHVIEAIASPTDYKNDKHGYDTHVDPDDEITGGENELGRLINQATFAMIFHQLTYATYCRSLRNPSPRLHVLSQFTK